MVGGRAYRLTGNLKRWVDQFRLWYAADLPSIPERDGLLIYLTALSYEYGLRARAKWSSEVVGSGRESARKLSSLWLAVVRGTPDTKVPAGYTGETARKSFEPMLDLIQFLSASTNEGEFAAWSRDCRNAVSQRALMGKASLDPL